MEELEKQALDKVKVIIDETPQEAENILRQCLRLYPDSDQSWAMLAVALYRQDKPAGDAIHEAIRIAPNSVGHWATLGVTSQDPEERLRAFECALSLDPDNVGSVSNLAMELRRRGEFTDSYNLLNNILDKHPNAHWVLFNKANLLTDMQLYKPAIANYKEALRIAGDDRPDYHFNLGWALLAMGRYAEGWQHFKYRDKLFTPCIHKKTALTHLAPEWNGECLNGKTIYLYELQGAGDKIQFIRYAKRLKDQGARVIFECPYQLMDLFSSLDIELEEEKPHALYRQIGSRIIPGSDECNDILPPFDYHADLFDLPRIFGETPESITGDKYLTVIKDTRYATQQLRKLKGYKIGIVYAGSPVHANDINRSIPLSEFAPLKELPAILFSLQKDTRKRFTPTKGIVDLACPGIVNYDLQDHIRDWEDTAQLVKLCNCIVSADTAVAHLAGAMGKKVYTLLPFKADWRWMTDRDDTPWYKSMQLIRQSTWGKWSDVIYKLTENLRNDIR